MIWHRKIIRYEKNTSSAKSNYYSNSFIYEIIFLKHIFNHHIVLCISQRSVFLVQK